MFTVILESVLGVCAVLVGVALAVQQILALIQKLKQKGPHGDPQYVDVESTNGHHRL